MEPAHNQQKPDVQGATVFKLVAAAMPSSGQDTRFKPAGVNEVDLIIPPVPGPDTSGKTAAPPAVPPPPTAAVAAPAPDDDDQRIRAKIEELLKTGRRAKELEEENRNLLKMVARLQAENDTLRTK